MNLRLEDKSALHLTLKKQDKVVPLFIFDSDILERLQDRKDRRVDFMHQALQPLTRQLEALGSMLFVCQGRPEPLIGEPVYPGTDYPSKEWWEESYVATV